MIPRIFRISLLSIPLVAGLHGQSTAARPYLDAFTEWRKLDPALEREAATGGAQTSDRATRAYSAVTKYAVARSAYLRSLADESGQLLLWIQNSATGGEIDLAPIKLEQALVSAATDTVTRDIATYSKDTDRGIVQLRQALERERVALVELTQSINDRDRAWSKAQQLLEPSEEIRARAMAQYQTLSTGYSSAAAAAEREEPSWAGYYQALSDAVSRPVPPPAPAPAPAPAPVVTSLSAPAVNAGGNATGTAVSATGDKAETPTPVTIAGVRIMNPVNPVNPVNPDAAKAVPTPNAAPSIAPAEVRTAPAPVSEPPSPTATTAAVIPALPLGRYIGEWTYPVTGGMFFGVQPESIDLEIQESNGRMTGSLTGRFKVAAGTAPELKLAFAGDLRTTRNQIFIAETGDGAKGTLELIPGNAYNLLEVNFHTEPKPGKIRLVNFVVVKK